MGKTIWDEVSIPHFPKLKRSTRFDVVVVGGGITGLSAAYFLKKAGKKVCLLERDRIGSGDTGSTTAHLTYVIDSRLSELVKNFGEQNAHLVWHAGATAIEVIEAVVRENDIECEFRRVPGFFYAAIHGEEDETKQFQEEAELARKLGFDAQFVASVPCLHKPGIRFSNQAKFHPRKYLAALAGLVHGDGCVIAEETEVTEVDADPLVVKCDDVNVACDYLVIATHVPLMGATGLVSATLLQTKLAPYSSYVVGARLPKGTLPEMSLWDTSDPYYYLRVDSHADHDYVIFGGEDNKTGQAGDTRHRYDRLEKVLEEILPGAKVDRRWSGQVIETNDGLPFIGETADKQFVATGFSGNGMTFGTLGAMMGCDKARGRENPWQELFDVGRKKVRGGTWDYIKENFDYPFYFVKDRLTPAEGKSTADVKPGEGKIIKHDGQRVACSRDEKGKLTTVSAVCTHMGCLVRWNQAEQTWDCPCHGSRFQASGEVLAGPAETPLEPVKLTETKKKSTARNGTRRRPRSASAHKDR